MSTDERELSASEFWGLSSDLPRLDDYTNQSLEDVRFWGSDWRYRPSGPFPNRVRARAPDGRTYLLGDVEEYVDGPTGHWPGWDYVGQIT
jgi:hypothetical protein